MKTIFITGSSSGIGKETAKLFQSKNWNVVATMRRPEEEEELTKLDNVFVTKLDVLNLESIQDAVKKAISKFGKIDVLVNNAGYGAYGTLESFSKEQIIRQFHTNVIGLLDVTKALLPHFRENEAGTIVNVSSIGGRITFPLGSLYHGTKFAVEGISESLNYEVGQFGGKVKIIEPGSIATDFGTRFFDFSHNEELTQYNNLVTSALDLFPKMQSNSSPVNLASETIYEAVTDESGKLRYVVGEDAKLHELNRKQFDDETFAKNMLSQYGL